MAAGSLCPRPAERKARQRATAVAARVKEETAEEEALPQPKVSAGAGAEHRRLLSGTRRRPRPVPSAPRRPHAPLPLSSLPPRPRRPWPGRTARAAPPGKSKLKTSRKFSSSRRPSERKWGPGTRGWRWPRPRVPRRLLPPLPPSPRPESGARCDLIVWFSALWSPPCSRRVVLRPRTRVGIAPGRGSSGGTVASGKWKSTSPDTAALSTSFSPRVTGG